jgi:hypothetical protein
VGGRRDPYLCQLVFYYSNPKTRSSRIRVRIRKKKEVRKGRIKKVEYI